MVSEIIASILIAPLGAQVIKMVLNTISNKKIDFKDLYVTGGMPSSHSALVTALATSIYFLEGLSTLFLFSIVFSGIVIRDALGVRLTVGREGEILKKLMKKHKMKTKVTFAKGHTPLQALAGSIFGVVVAILVHFLI